MFVSTLKLSHMSTPLHSLADLQHLLLDLISPARPVSQAQLDALGDPDWSRILEMARQHRLGPLLYWQIGRAHAHLKYPDHIKIQLSAIYQKSVFRNLMVQRELLLIHNIFKSADIPFIGLKGAFLAFQAYPQPALRPLRDIDILVSSNQAIQAFSILLTNGLKRIQNYNGSPEAWLNIHRHLPPLRSPSETLNVELHNRLFSPNQSSTETKEFSHTPEFWQRTVELSLAKASVRYQSPTDLLLHLIVHAVYQHEFDNGPLLLSDLSFLLDTHPIDWNLFWSMANLSQYTRGCWLALKLTERYWGKKDITWPAHLEITPLENDDILKISAQIMLRNFDARAHVRLHSDMKSKYGLKAKIHYVSNKLFTSKNVLAAQYAVSADDWHIYAYYPIRWWWLLSQKLPGLWQTKKVVGLQNEILQIKGLRQWLQQEQRNDLTDTPST